MRKLTRKDVPIGQIAGPEDMNVNNPGLGQVKWFTSYCMGPYESGDGARLDEIGFFAPMLKLRWVKAPDQSPDEPSQTQYCYRLVVYVEYDEHFFLPVYYNDSGDKVRSDIQVKFMGNTIMVTMGFMLYEDAGLPMPQKPETGTPLTKYSKFTFDFESGVSDMIKSSSIYVSCIYGDPKESTISKVIVEDVDEL